MRVLKFLFLLFTFYFLLFTLPIPVHAQSLPSSGQAPIPTYVSPTSPIYTDLLVHNLFHSFSCLSVGQSIIGKPCLSYQNGIPVLSKVDLQGGALGASTSLIGLLYKNPPVRTIDYLASVGQGFGFVKEAHAQVTGSGAGVLSPVLKLWEVSRNISYVFMIIIFVVIGLMVMFRQRINPQTVITAQAALPGLVIGLVMITFSFFLAGLISDMAFVGTNVVGYYFASAQGKTNDLEIVNLAQHISDKNILRIFGPLTGIVGRDDVSGSLDTIFNELPGSTQFVLRTIVGFLTLQFFAPLAGGIGSLATTAIPPWGLVVGPITNLLTGITGMSAPTFTLGFALSFIATLALIYAMIRLLLRLVSAFLTIIFLTISAPFQFLAASLPGRQGLATNWILNMLGNILIFPAVLAVLYFIAFILGPGKMGNDYPLKISNSNQIENSNLVPTAYAEGKLNIIGTYNFPLFGGLNFDFIQILLAFGALMALPKIPDVVVGAIGRMGQAGQMLGQEISSGVRSGQGYSRQFQEASSSTGSNLKRGIIGETQWVREGSEWQPRYGLPGAFGVLTGRQTIGKSGKGTAARGPDRPPPKT